jgi:isopentenyl phosphate kinase
VIGTKSLIVKFGGSVITDKSKRFTVRDDVLKRLAEELTSAKDPLVLVHGGGSFGHPLASEYGLDSGYKEKRQLKGFSLTHRAMERLNTKVVEALQDVGFAAVAIQPSACAVVEDGQIVSMELRPFHKLLELGLVPVTYGDVVPDLTRGMSILSGDQLVVHLAQELGAQRIILGVDVEGVYMGDPKVDRDAKIVPEITPESWSEVERSVGEVRAPDVTGGMANKVRELLKLAEHGIEAQIVNAMKPGILKRAILGERLGTRIAKG